MRRKRLKALYRERTVIDSTTGRERRQYHYQGRYVRLLLTGDEKRTLGRRLAALVTVAALMWLTVGFQNVPSGRCFYALPFFLAMPLPLFFWGLATFRFSRLGERLTEPQLDAGVDALSRGAWGVVVLGGLRVAGGAVLLSLGGAGDQLAVECLCEALILLSTLCALAGARLSRRIPCEELPAPEGANEPRM